jgi:hypothetical protein
VHLPHGIARAYQKSAADNFNLKALCLDLWLAVEMQTLTPELGVAAKRLWEPRSSARGSRREVQDIRCVSLPAGLDRAFAELARAHGLRPSVAISFVAGWRAQHRGGGAG